MTAANRRHLDDLSFDQFKAGILMKDARLAHALVLGHGKVVLADR
jgi:hypothetical protein